MPAHEDLRNSSPAAHLQIGPRLELELVKGEEGLCTGRVLFHAHVSKPPQEAAAQQTAVEDREQLRAKRRLQQVCALPQGFDQECAVSCVQPASKVA